MPFAHSFRSVCGKIIPWASNRALEHRTISTARKLYRPSEFGSLEATLIGNHTKKFCNLKEYLIGKLDNPSYGNILRSFQSYRNVTTIQDYNFNNRLLWVLTHDNVVLDMFDLEMHYLSGKHQLSDEEIALSWQKKCDKRLRFLGLAENISHSEQYDGNFKAVELEKELNVALSAVHKASFLTLNMQSTFKNLIDMKVKADNTPVTIADLSVQAVILDQLSSHFPNDKFIAEEDSNSLRSDKLLRNQVLKSLKVLGDQSWDDERLFRAIDKGGENSTSNNRVWVLDPIDGTKGFIRGEHFCIALALLEDGKPVLSVLGCPNLSAKRVLSGDRVEIITAGRHIRTDSENEIFLPGVGSGTIFFAISGQGAYLRSLSMPLGAGTEVQVSSVSDAKDSILCESAEASFGNRETTKRIKTALRMRKEFLRLDGQCKLCLVGSGMAESNLRLPPSGYVEMIWDHAAGCHYIEEAGGKVTDLAGNKLDFSHGRYLSPSVTGIVSSNGLLHSTIVSAVNIARK